MTALALVSLFALVLINGVFVAAEFALVRTRRGKMEQLASEGSKRASLVLVQLDRIDEYLSACQLGITMASIGIGFLGEPALADLIDVETGIVVDLFLSLRDVKAHSGMIELYSFMQESSE